MANISLYIDPDSVRENGDFPQLHLRVMNTLHTPTREFIAPLHGLRGIAVLYVVISHLGLSGLYLVPIAHDSIGKVGVWIFFVLSAFLLTGHLFADLQRESNKAAMVLQYITGRFFRIFPLYVITLCLYAAVGDLTNLEMARHLFLIDGMHHFWAISVEFQYYLVIPLIAVAALRYSRVAVMAGLTVAAAFGVFVGVVFPEMVFSNDLAIVPKLIPFVLGSALALYMSHKPEIFVRSDGCLALVSLAGLSLATVLYQSLRYDELAAEWSIWISILIGISVAGLVRSALNPSSVAAKILGYRLLVFIGEISFSIYLLHLLVIKLAVTLIKNPSLAAWLSLVVSIAVATVSYRTIEVPGVKAGRVAYIVLSKAIRNRD